ncbi:MAG TPA: L,D-transpeptidase [Polyangiaceae bacterium]|nr:L,D-transpeptidase [Polyangiaceae bacterium]
MRAAISFVAVALLAGCAANAEAPGADRPREALHDGHAVATIDKGAASADDVAEGHADAQAKTADEAAAPPKKDDRKRIGALGPHTWIWKKPSRDGLAMGKMRIGTSVALKSPDPVDGPGCKGKWYAIEPRGYVCDDDTATLDLDDPYYKVLEFSAPAAGVWPYRYAHSNGAPMYSRVPSPSEWPDAEKEYGPVNTWKPLGAWAKGHEELITNEPIKATDEVPYFLKDGKRTAPGGHYDTRVLVWKRIPPGSMLAYSRAFEMYGRVWLLTPDGMVVPADRVSDMKRSTFHGVHLDESEMHLPFAWNRTKGDLPIYKKDASGKMVPSGETFPMKSPVEITDGSIEKDDWVYYELRKRPGFFVGKTLDPKKQLDVELSVTRAATTLPKGVSPDEKWIEVHTVPGTLTAYVGLTPVMTTLFSPGKGGPPLPTYKFPEDHSKYATTALGTFPLEWKEHVATMSNEHGAPKVLWFTDVPNQQYLRAPLAMHVAYWHEDFGKRKSAECVNVSPIDGDWLFGWTLPRVPEGWNAVGAGQGNGESTPVIVTTN